MTTSGLARRLLLPVPRRAPRTVAATAALATSPTAQTAAGEPSEALCRPRPDAGQERAADLHLLRRATFGATPALLEEVRTVGRATWVDQQLAPQGVDDAECQALVARLPRAGMPLAQAWSGGVPQYGWDGMWDLGRATLARQTWSRRQLFEVIVDLWSDHLHVASPSDDVWYCRMDYDVTVLRAHALGRFEDMLVASARHPAMLWYLDNARSTKNAPNENYGRELLELHTVGVAAGYTEADVVASTRLLTGLGVDGKTGLRRFRPDQHDTGAVTVMGWTAPARRPEDGEAVQVAFLRWLAHHPATARHLATKLARRFVSDDPPAALVTRLAQTYLDSGTAVVPVVRELLTSPELAEAVGAKTKRPREDVVSTVRVLGHSPDATGTYGVEQLYWMVRGRGHAPADWAPPNGFPDVAGAWQSAAGSLAAWSQHMEIANGWWPRGLLFTPPKDLLPSPVPTTVGALVDALAARVLLQAPTPAERAAVISFTGRLETSLLRPGDEWLTWRLGSLVVLLLDTPTFATR